VHTVWRLLSDRVGGVWRARAGLAARLVALAFGGAAQAAPVGTLTFYTDPSIGIPAEIAHGPDGALWFTNQSNNTIGRITTGGAISN